MSLQVWLPLNKNLNVIPDITSFSKESGVSLTEDSNGYYKVQDSTHGAGSRWGVYYNFAVKPNTRYTLYVYSKSTTGVNCSIGVQSFGYTPTWPAVRDTNASSTEKLTTYAWTTGAGDSIARVYLAIGTSATPANNYVFYKQPMIIEAPVSQGLSKSSIASDAYSIDANGKLGYCIKTSNASIDLGYNGNIVNESGCSVCGWFKFNQNEINSILQGLTIDSTRTTPIGNLIGNNSYGGFGLQWQANNMNSSNKVFSNIYVFGNLRTATAGYQSTAVASVPFDTWVHAAVTFNKNENKQRLYVNGTLVSTVSIVDFSDAISRNMQLNYNGVCGGNGPGVSIPFYCNDIRIYNHALNENEIKKISQGLVVHYPLNRGGLGPNNLIKNGFGELGSENWNSSTSISTTDVPTGYSDIKASFSGGTIEHIKIYPTHTYKFSTWIKATATSGNTYPSLYPYDVDGNFISTQNCPEGFNLNTMTTLKQQLKPGDTKIYVNDLSQWNTNSGNHFDVAAIFSYVDNHGYIWPEGTYTRNCPAFASSTEAKTNLDKINNIITLLSAYTGPTMPVGTKVCQATYGNTYFYPLGGISLASITDWTYKTGTFSGNHARLRYAKTVIFATYGNNRMAGIKLEDITATDSTGTTEYDTSGFCNNGTRTGTFSWTSDTLRYSVSQVFSENQYIVEPNEINTTDSTITLWIKSALSANAHVLDARNSSEVGKQPIFQYTNGSIQTGGNNAYVTTNTGLLVANTWVHITLVQSGNSLLIYKNGSLFQTLSCNNSPIIKPTIGARLNFANKYTGQLSDFRIYTTALSADDVLELYKMGRSS